MRKRVFLLMICGFLAATGRSECGAADTVWARQAQSPTIKLSKLRRFKIDPYQAQLREVSRIIPDEKAVHILDARSSRIFVFDRKARLKQEIGRPGEGPGELQGPRDFAVGSDGRIHVVCSRVRRIEVFSPEGKFIERIKLRIPEDQHFAYPSCLLLDSSGGYLIGYGLSRHLVDAYDSGGRFRKTLLRREETIHIPGNNLGNASQIEWTRGGHILLHFSIFDGTLVSLESGREAPRKFAFHDEAAAAWVRKLREEYARKSRTRAAHAGTHVFHEWSHFCADRINRLYAMPLRGKPQRLYVHSPDGRALGFTVPRGLPDGARVQALACHEDEIFFATFEAEVFTARIKSPGS